MLLLLLLVMCGGCGEDGVAGGQDVPVWSASLKWGISSKKKLRARTLLLKESSSRHKTGSDPTFNFAPTINYITYFALGYTARAAGCVPWGGVKVSPMLATNPPRSTGFTLCQRQHTMINTTTNNKLFVTKTAKQESQKMPCSTKPADWEYRHTA